MDKFWTPLNYKGFEEYFIKQDTHPRLGGLRYEFKFSNNFSVRVLKHIESFGNEEDLFEMEIFKNGKIKSIRGRLTNEEVLDYLDLLSNVK